MRERIDENPLRAFDSKDEGTAAVMANAPTMLDRLEAEDAEHFAAVRRLLDRAGIAYASTGRSSAGSTITPARCSSSSPTASVRRRRSPAGGRYDGLIELLGGPATPACGWAAGIERILLALDERPPSRRRTCSSPPRGHRERAFALVRELRAAGLRAELDLAGRSLKGQMKQADRIGAAGR